MAGAGNPFGPVAPIGNGYRPSGVYFPASNFAGQNANQTDQTELSEEAKKAQEEEEKKREELQKQLEQAIADFQKALEANDQQAAQAALERIKQLLGELGVNTPDQPTNPLEALGRAHDAANFGIPPGSGFPLSNPAIGGGSQGGGGGQNFPVEPIPGELKDIKPANPNAQIPNYNNPNKAQINEMLGAAADKYGIPPDILKAIAWQESGWNPKAVGDGGNSSGMMQIYKVAHPDYDVARGKADPAYNIDYGARFLKNLHDRYGSWEQAIKHYNGSGPAADRYRNSVLSLVQNKPWQRA